MRIVLLLSLALVVPPALAAAELPSPASAEICGRCDRSIQEGWKKSAHASTMLGFAVDPAVVSAMTAMAGRIEIVSAERVRDELVKLVCAKYPRRGLEVLVETGLADRVCPRCRRCGWRSTSTTGTRTSTSTP